MTSEGPTEAVAPPAQRGRTTISERALRRIAGHDATVITDVVTANRVRAHARHRQVDLQLNLTLAYPAPAAATAHRARQRVVAQLQRFTGYEVSAVDITISYEHRSS